VRVTWYRPKKNEGAALALFVEDVFFLGGTGSSPWGGVRGRIRWIVGASGCLSGLSDFDTFSTGTTGSFFTITNHSLLRRSVRRHESARSRVFALLVYLVFACLRCLVVPDGFASGHSCLHATCHLYNHLMLGHCRRTKGINRKCRRPGKDRADHRDHRQYAIPRNSTTRSSKSGTADMHKALRTYVPALIGPQERPLIGTLPHTFLVSECSANVSRA
jgi:hypothetical protein